MDTEKVWLLSVGKMVVTVVGIDKLRVFTVPSISGKLGNHVGMAAPEFHPVGREYGAAGVAENLGMSALTLPQIPEEATPRS